MFRYFIELTRWPRVMISIQVNVTSLVESINRWTQRPKIKPSDTHSQRLCFVGWPSSDITCKFLSSRSVSKTYRQYMHRCGYCAHSMINNMANQSHRVCCLLLSWCLLYWNYISACLAQILFCSPCLRSCFCEIQYISGKVKPFRN